ALFALVIAALMWLLFDRLDQLGLAALNGSEHVIYATGWQIVAELWMLPALGAVVMLLAVFIYVKFFAAGGKPACCGAETPADDA
ncbi:hypothetical protein, partial [Sulfurivirga sp.]|uniref:hypothetical protein n=1 Tax=Sulfurivirga sp. TaxID=2614236 RepID=UPI0025ECC47C